MKKYKVEITREALQDMEDIYNYIANSIDGATFENYILRIENHSLFAKST